MGKGTFDITVDNQRRIAMLAGFGKVRQGIQHLSGVNLFETVDQDGTPGLSIILGPINNGRRGRKPQAIDVALTAELRPEIKGSRLFKADAQIVDGYYQLVRQQKEGVALRIITTGLLAGRDGSTTVDYAEIASKGAKLRYHGAFPLTIDAATVIGEGLDMPVTAQSKVIADERFGSINGLVGVPRIREVTIEAVVGGPIIVGQIDGSLRITELTATGWKTYDVTDSHTWQQKFMDLAMQDIEYLIALDKDAKRRTSGVKKFQSIKAPPIDHVDAH